jgi:hypothetical protein
MKQATRESYHYTEPSKTGLGRYKPNKVRVYL